LSCIRIGATVPKCIDIGSKVQPCISIGKDSEEDGPKIVYIDNSGSMHVEYSYETGDWYVYRLKCRELQNNYKYMYIYIYIKTCTVTVIRTDACMGLKEVYLKPQDWVVYDTYDTDNGCTFPCNTLDVTTQPEGTYYIK
jgi:hypothetical protein